jgi:endogenous inhibitor of DNA gyrase (YacG/DUF329 family)
MHDVKCPYCGTDQEINHDDGYGYEEDELHNQECHECGKTFVFTTSIHIDHEAQKADCLNGGEHKWELTLTFPPKFARGRCSQCGQEQPQQKNGVPFSP